MFAFLANNSQVFTKDQSDNNKRIDIEDIQDMNFESLIINQGIEDELYIRISEQESKFTPILKSAQLNMNEEDFESASYEQLNMTLSKTISAWTLNNNIKSIEQIYSTITYLKDMWINDRNGFFEELWFFIKKNISSSDLKIIFHDLQEPTEKQKEKGQKPSIRNAIAKGEKNPQIFEATDVENKLMKEYESEFQEVFNITDYSVEKSQLVFTGKINLSPILVMARTKKVNQLQKSILIALFEGLQA